MAPCRLFGYRGDMQHDAFICHASEDKDSVVRSLALALQEHGLKVWYDEFNLSIGDSLLREIERGLRTSRFGIVVLSRAFFAKDWPQKELAALANLESASKRTIILPVWHEVDANYVRRYSTLLADRVGLPTAQGVGNIASKIAKRIAREDKNPPKDLDAALHERASTVAKVLAQAGIPVRSTWDNEVICPRCHNRVEASSDTVHHQCDACALVFTVEPAR